MGKMPKVPQVHKNIVCVFCKEEEWSTKSDGSRRRYTSPNEFACAHCTQLLLNGRKTVSEYFKSARISCEDAPR